MKAISKTLLCTLAAVLALSFVASAREEAPRWAAAIAHLEAAKVEMTQAKARGGKKDEALLKIDEAIALLKSDMEDIKEKKKQKQ